MDRLGAAWVDEVKGRRSWTSSAKDPGDIKYKGLVSTMLGTGRQLAGCGLAIEWLWSTIERLWLAVEWLGRRSSARTTLNRFTVTQSLIKLVTFPCSNGGGYEVYNMGGTV